MIIRDSLLKTTHLTWAGIEWRNAILKVLVTGATGFIGANLVRALVNGGYEVRALTRNGDVSQRLKGMDIEICQRDLAENVSLKGVLEGVNCVCHLAGVLGGTTPDEEYYHQLHVRGTANLLAACDKFQIEKFIHCSTAGVLGPSGNGIADENSPYNPTNIYENTKAEGEKLVIKNARKKLLPTIILRPGMVYGPGDMHHLGLFSSIKKRYFFLINSGKSYLDPVFIEDVAQAFIKALETSETADQIYMIAGPNPVTVKEVAHVIARALDLPDTFMTMPTAIAMLLAKILTGLSKFVPFDSPLTPSRVKFLTESRASSIKKAIEQLSYNPVGLEKGISETLKWYKKNGYI